VPGRASQPEFLSKKTRLRSVQSRKALYPGSAISGKKYIALMGFAKGPREKSVLGGKAFYPGSVISEFHCNDF